LIRNKSASVRGVSVQANYLANECANCHKRFQSDEELYSHMEKDHFIKNYTKVPKGIVFEALSLVLAPEEPGVSTTTIQIAETKSGVKQLFETVIKAHETTEHLDKHAPVDSKTSGHDGTVMVAATGHEFKNQPQPIMKPKVLGEPCSPELKKCVDDLISQGKDESSAWAICRSRIGETSEQTIQRLEHAMISHEAKDAERDRKLTEAIMEHKKHDAEQLAAAESGFYFNGEKYVSAAQISMRQEKILEQLSALMSELTLLKKAQAETKTQVAKETLDYNKKLEERAIKAENALEKIHGKFKGTDRSIPKPEPVKDLPPYMKE